jgi:transcriptional regulator with XRE-family HTH domain
MSGAVAFGEALQRHRHARRLTQAELAERAGLSERAISDLERGLRRSPQRATVRLLVDALGLASHEAESFELAARLNLAHLEPHQKVDGTIQHNLPPALTSVVGREDELARLYRLLDSGADRVPEIRLVTSKPYCGGCVVSTCY